MIDAGKGCSFIAPSSAAGTKSLPGHAHYSAAGRGVIGLVESAAPEPRALSGPSRLTMPMGSRDTDGCYGPTTPAR